MIRYSNDFDTKYAIWRYDLREEADVVIVRYGQVLPSLQEQEVSDEKMLISQMHIANIPEVVAAILRVFQTKDGDVLSIEKHGDRITVAMIADDHMQFRNMVVRDSSRRLKTELPNIFEFVFEDLILTNSPPLPRTPTPAMIWVTDTLKKIYDDWEKNRKP